ncbi:MAG: bifunctional phosphopantothenoylcysteine decarboxylase/phosphopantothenate--cysteine ligase CoaBC [Bacteroidota bacterium]
MTNILSGKKILLGVTGGIAAYKSCLLLRELVKMGAEVRVLMTPSACKFVAPLTFSTLSGHEVKIDIFPENGASFTGTWHIDYGVWADLMIIAPATVNTIAKIANGMTDNALTTVVAALRGKLIVAPAADCDMYSKTVTGLNIKKLEDLYGAFIVEAEEGELASGLKGKGRMADIEKIVSAALLVTSEFSRDLTGKRILITAGPTFEDIDPVRFIGNRSSGKMGFSIARAAYLRGAEVTLISGPVSISSYPEIKLLKVRSAEDMKHAVDECLPDNDWLIMSAAVADYCPENVAASKIKKEDNFLSIPLKKTTDILSSISKEDKLIAGFALETDNEFENAKLKLHNKGLDMIVLNSLNDEGAGFEFETNKITVISRTGEIRKYPLVEKFIAANYILSELKILC